MSIALAASRGFARLLLAAALTAAGLATAQDPAPPPVADDEPIEELTVKGQLTSAPDLVVVSPTRATPNAPDTAALLKLVPGGDVVSNGPLSGQVQYRGMWGARVQTLVNDMFISPGGPNLMDAPLSYAPRVLVDSIEVDRGISPVSRGPETIGGSARARLKSSAFGDAPTFRFSGDLQVAGRSADDSFNGGGILSAANDTHRFHVLGSAEFGDDLRAPTGTVAPTRFHRYTFGGGYGLQLGAHAFGVDYRHNDTDDTGTPALPSDIRFINSELVKGEYTLELAGVDVSARINYADVDHRMDNFRLRKPPAMPMRWRQVDAWSETIGYALSGGLDFLSGRLRFGFDGHASQHDVDISNPNDPAFFATSFNGAGRNLYGFFGEWRGSPAERWELLLGLRYTRVDSDAGKVDSLPAQVPGTPAARLRDGFNSSRRDRGDDLFDYLIQAGFAPADGWRIELATARKTRAPSYIERYLWAPMESTGGLADGRNYVGDVGLVPEKAYEVEGGVEWRCSRFWIAPRAFYRWIDDYIQGTPSTDPDVIAMSSMNGDPEPLAFSNVEAELYGVDTLYGVQLPFDFQLDGVLSFVRGRRRDIHDDLYRIAPLRGRTTLRYARERWSVALEGVYAASQHEVSRTNAETTSKGWGIMNVFGSWEPIDGIVLEFGIDNLLDDVQRDHLAGISRVTSSGVTAGERLPGPKRTFYGRVHGRF